jgi:hypothetical protein
LKPGILEIVKQMKRLGSLGDHRLKKNFILHFAIFTKLNQSKQQVTAQLGYESIPRIGFHIVTPPLQISSGIKI